MERSIKTSVNSVFHQLKELFMNLKTSTAAVAIVATVSTNTPIKHFGMCDASAAIPLSSTLFVVANDEDNILRVYKRDESGEPVASQDLSSFLQIDPDNPEADIEAATRIGNRIYWITSHGANKNGHYRPNRHRFFATDIDSNGNLKPVGVPFSDLVQTLDDFADLKDYHLGEAAKKTPKSEGALNIEGLTSTTEGKLLIGFRNPIPNGKALLVPLENSQEVIDGDKKPMLGKPILLDLDGLGIRSIEYSTVKNTYFIIAGAYDASNSFQLYQWSGDAADVPVRVNGIDFRGLNPEELLIYPEEKDHIQILSDDGSKKLNGQTCKDLENANDKNFRSVWINLSPIALTNLRINDSKHINPQFFR
jgi:hypothetical protein